MTGSEEKEKGVPIKNLVLDGFSELSLVSSLSPAHRQIMNFQYLGQLQVDQCENLKTLFCMKAHRSLPELNDLTIYECHELEEIIAENGEQLSNSEVCFPKLQRIEVFNCHKLRSLFSVAVVRMLPQLVNLHISNATQLEQIIMENGELVQLSSSEVCFPKLETIQVSFCHKLKSLFSVAMVRMLPQLSSLSISNATQLEEVFSHVSGDDSINVSEIVLPNLRTMRLEFLPSFIDVCKDLKLKAVKLESSSISECPKVTASFREMQRIVICSYTDDEEGVFFDSSDDEECVFFDSSDWL